MTTFKPITATLVARCLFHKYTTSSPEFFLGAPRSSVASGAGLEPGAPRIMPRHSCGDALANPSGPRSLFHPRIDGESPRPLARRERSLGGGNGHACGGRLRGAGPRLGVQCVRISACSRSLPARYRDTARSSATRDIQQVCLPEGGHYLFFFLGLITLSDRCDTKSVRPLLKTAKKSDCS